MIDICIVICCSVYYYVYYVMKNPVICFEKSFHSYGGLPRAILKYSSEIWGDEAKMTKISVEYLIK